MRAPEFWSRKDGTARIAAAALSPFGWIYGAVTDWKRTNTLSYRARAKIICVGNLTAGGSGKTPIVEAIMRILKTRGQNTMVLSRGYGGRLQGAAIVNPRMHSAADVGDEPLLLSASALVIVARNRRLGAVLADIEGADIIVMDDGYQNFTLEKDLSILVVDAEQGFGNGHILPAGPLRESIRGGLARADAVVLVGSGTPALPGFSGPVVRARIVPRNGEVFAGRKAVAFAGIGRPAKFFDTLRALNVDLVEAQEFADHHAFTPDEVAQLKAKAKDNNAMLVTTEKDFMRLASDEREGVEVLRVEAEFESRETIDRILSKVMPPASQDA